jgi:hypothetical protein
MGPGWGDEKRAEIGPECERGPPAFRAAGRVAGVEVRAPHAREVKGA